ncbi:hypothetical protein OIV83_003732 [Microbotryomycetes sp. JL201]|nr:hypothetical protein OIV83_003732 [Microbotryomycetes sp. JL201]
MASQGAAGNAKLASAGGSQQAQQGPQQQPFRPLNVKDALSDARTVLTFSANAHHPPAASYLDRVKGTFTDQPEVYDRFLTIMKEFKSQGIDTPGVIERVSSLFRGHPALIQGFNTFLPPGYRIECSVSAPQDDGAVTTITVTTPLGMTTKTQLASHPNADNSANPSTSATAPSQITKGASQSNQSASGSGRVADSQLHLQSLPPTPATFASAQTGNTPIATPGAASFLSSHMGQSGPTSVSGTLGADAAAAVESQNDGSAPKPPMEFNHAINYVNKIKNRFIKDPETYKAFLEILQTYQKEGRAIQDVYAQVTQLFHGAPDLLDEFKQFLPDTSGEAVQAAASTPAQTSSGRTLKRPSAPMTKFEAAGPAKKPKTTKPKTDEKTKAKRSIKSTEPKKTDGLSEPQQHLPVETVPQAYPQMNPYPQSYPVPGYQAMQPVLPVAFAYEAPPPPPPPQPLLPPKPVASAPDMAFFKRVKEYINDDTTYHEFLKLLNLFTQDLINLPALVDRAYLFLKDDSSLWKEFRDIVGWGDEEVTGDYQRRIEVVAGRRVIENVPALDGSRRHERDEGVAFQTCGPSYRKLAPSQINNKCSGRDALCWEVLNDEWVSQPSWLSDEGFVAHRKNPFEEAMHRTEEERHEYDFHIEANLRTIALLEPIATRIAIMEADERATFRLKPGLGNQSKSIYQRVLKKIYGREQGLEVIQALHENPCVAVPIVLARLKQKDDEWKRAVREWNRVWRESDAKNFWKSLDHQGIALKASDKRLLTARALVTDIEIIRRTQKLKLAGAGMSAPIHAQLVYDFEDREALFDAIKLMLSYLDRTNTVPNAEKDKVDAFLRSFLPLLFAIAPAEFALEMTPVGDDAESADGASDAGTSVAGDMTDSQSVGGGSVTGTSRRGAGKRAAADLRKKALKNAGGPGRGRRGKAASSAPSSRGGSPAPSTETTETLATGNATDAAMSDPMPTVTSLASLITPDVEAEIAASREADGMSATGDTSREPSVVGEGEQAPPSPVLGLATEDGIETSAAETSDPGTPAPAATSGVAADASKGPELILPVEAKSHIASSRKQWNLFANSNFYVLIRLFQILYYRLRLLKTSAVAVAQPPPPLPITDKHVPSLSLSVTIQQSMPNGQTPAIAQQLYQRALGLCEKLFDGEVDQTTFEDSMRQMFATQGYMLFTIDKIMTGIMKQCQVATTDVKTRDLMELLRQDRAHADRSTDQQQLFYRTQAETALGQDENLYRIEWLSDRKLMSVQLLGKDAIPVEELGTVERDWVRYVRKFLQDEPTPGVAPESNAGPWLSRNARKARTLLPAEEKIPSDLHIRSKLQSRICMRSYRIFFVPNSEDELFRLKPAVGDIDAVKIRAAKVARFDRFVERRMAELEVLLAQQQQQKEEEDSRQNASNTLDVNALASSEESAKAVAAAEDAAESNRATSLGEGDGDVKMSDAS